jgi:hypothetical protein
MPELEERIRKIAFVLFSALEEQKPALFNRKKWKGRVRYLEMMQCKIRK